MNIADIKGNIHDKRVLTLLYHSQYNPTEEKLNLLASEYEADNDVYAFSCADDGTAIGVIILKRKDNTSFVIKSIAVDPSFRGLGVGSKLIDYAVKYLQCSEIHAETDDDAIGFYRKFGFDIQPLGEKYPGTARYLCTMKLS